MNLLSTKLVYEIMQRNIIKNAVPSIYTKNTKKKFEEEEYAKNYCQEKVCNFKCGCSLISYDKFKR